LRASAKVTPFASLACTRFAPDRRFFEVVIAIFHDDHAPRIFERAMVISGRSSIRSGLTCRASSGCDGDDRFTPNRPLLYPHAFVR
jgi:hypothetical protein